MSELAQVAPPVKEPTKSGPITDLVLTLPIFVLYHLGVVFLPIRNAADVTTRELMALADNSLLAYTGLTLGIGAAYVGALLLFRQRGALRPERFAWLAGESVLYAIAMRLIAGWVVGKVFLGAVIGGPFAGFIMSLGAGFYEEIAFRVILYGLGLKLLVLITPSLLPLSKLWLTIGWAVICALIFSGWHYVGELGDPFEPKSFVFRAVCGLVFTAIYHFRGFAPAVWTHALYDIWVLVL
ncbi:MAG: CPBP family intramembrane metalloprotease [Polyangiaceae bacterium]|nr:CPBP family intramembrane metalloprotease [Polyangiaceae bacterium]MCW5790325.1 CPBP family intramembrane metalloprotease [Polyangiaceae bacterium]